MELPLGTTVTGVYSAAHTERLADPSVPLKEFLGG